MTESLPETPTVVIVEDDRPLAELFDSWLDESFAVRVCNTGQEALDTLDEKVDVVLLDRRMPGLSGDDVLDRINDCGLDCHVVMVTAVRPDFDIVDMAFDDYLVKPVDADTLRQTVEHVLGRVAYSNVSRELWSLASKQAALQAEKRQEELESSAEFLELETRIAELRGRAADEAADLEAADFDALFRALDDEKDGDRTAYGAGR